MMMKKTAKLFTVVLVICAMLMSMISTTLVSAEEANLPEAIGEEVTSVETIETEEPAAEEPEAEEPAAEEPAAEEPAADEPVAVEPVADEPVADEPVADEPVADEPAAEEPVVEEPAVEEPVVVEPVANEPVVEEPAAVEPVVEEPTAAEPVADEPVADEPVADEPVADEPAADEPVEEEKEFTQMFVNGAATVYENPVVDEEHEVCKMQDGESIEVCKYDEDWFEVKTGGYIMKENLRLEAEKQIEEEPVAEEPAAEEPVVEETADEEPAADGESVAEEPTVDEEPVVEEPAADEEPTAEEETIEDYETPLGIYEYKTIVLGDEETGISVRENADSLAAIYTTLPAGTEVTVLRQDGDWVMVFANDAYGFVYIDDLAGYLDLEEKEEPAEGTAYIEKKVTIFSSRRAQMTPGEIVTLSTKIEGFDGYEVRYIWECDKHDGAGFQVINGENNSTLDFAASIESLSWDWQVTVQYR